MLTYNFENPVSTLVKCKRNDLAVVDTDGCELYLFTERT